MFTFIRKKMAILLAWGGMVFPLCAAREESGQLAAQKAVEAANNARLMTVFLDDTEASIKNEYISVTSSLMRAMRDKAGPIIASCSLLHSIIDGAYTHKKSKDAQAAIHFKAVLEKGEEWDIKELHEHLVIMIPKEHEASYHKEGLSKKLTQVESITADSIVQRYALFKEEPERWSLLSQKTGFHFVDALKRKIIFDPDSDIEWVIYLQGHGDYGHSIATLSFQEFAEVLNFFEKEVKVGLLAYDSCEAAGFNAAQVYGELKKPRISKEYLLTGQQRFSSEYAASIVRDCSFPVATHAVADAETKGVIKVLDDCPVYFDAFIKQYRDDKHNYLKILEHVMPILKSYTNKSNVRIPANLKGNFPLIRLPHSPIWVPLINSKEGAVHITETMAKTRTKSLELGIGNYKNSKMVLIDTNDIPFDIVLHEGAVPHVVIMLPGDVIVYVEKLVQKNRMVISHFPEFMDLGNPLSGNFYKGRKCLYIKELVICNHQGLDEEYENVVIDFSQKATYYTDKVSKQIFVINKEGAVPLLKQDTYLKLVQQISARKTYDSEKAVLEHRQDGENKEKDEQQLMCMYDLVQKKEQEQATINFREAVIRNDLNAAREYLRQGACVHVHSLDGKPLLMHSAITLETARLLIEHGASVNETYERTGGSPLMNAVIRYMRNAQEEDRIFIELLIAHGADILALDTNGNSVFMRSNLINDAALNNILEDSFRNVIQKIIDEISVYKLLVEPYYQELQELKNKHGFDNRDVARVNEIEKRLYVCMHRLEEAERRQLLEMMFYINNITYMVDQIPQFSIGDKNLLERIKNRAAVEVKKIMLPDSDIMAVYRQIHEWYSLMQQSFETLNRKTFHNFIQEIVRKMADFRVLMEPYIEELCRIEELKKATDKEWRWAKEIKGEIDYFFQWSSETRHTLLNKMECLENKHLKLQDQNKLQLSVDGGVKIKELKRVVYDQIGKGGSEASVENVRALFEQKYQNINSFFDAALAESQQHEQGGENAHASAQE